MCLDMKIKNLKNTSGIGYKSFAKDGRMLIFPYRRGIVKLNKWLKAIPIKLPFCKEPLKPSYSSGFHIYCEVEDAKSELIMWREDVVRKVMYRKARILGLQDGKEVIVADEIKVLPLK